jgi:hypothetical protein
MKKPKLTKAEKPIEIVSYSEKAIVIWGDTKPFKDQLKEIGAKFNPYLRREGVKTSGWIMSKKKYESISGELKTILNI